MAAAHFPAHLRVLRPLYSGDDAAHPQAQACAACEVRRHALFGALDAQALDHIHQHIADVSLAADERLFDLGERGGFVYTVREGILRFERPSQNGQRRIVRLAGRGDLIGQEALLQRAYGDEVRACLPAHLCRIPIAMVSELGQESQALPRELMRRWQDELTEAQEWATELAMGSARRRMLMLLARLQGLAQPDGRIWLPRREEMAAMLDMTVETASRLVSALKREGVLLEVHARLARLSNPALRTALEAAAD